MGHRVRRHRAHVYRVFDSKLLELLFFMLDAARSLLLLLQTINKLILIALLGLLVVSHILLLILLSESVYLLS